MLSPNGFRVRSSMPLVPRMAGDGPFGIVAYGYGSRDSYAFVGGANVRKIYDPLPLIK